MVTGLLGRWRLGLVAAALATYGVTHYPALSRLWTMKQEVLDLRTAIDEEPFVRGSRGQLVPHPGTRVRNSLLSEIRLLENRFGLNPMSHRSLGLDFSRAVRSIEDLANVPNVERDPRLEVVPDPVDGER